MGFGNYTHFFLPQIRTILTRACVRLLQLLNRDRQSFVHNPSLVKWQAWQAATVHPEPLHPASRCKH